MKEIENKMREMKDMIDVRKLMNSRPELKIPEKVYVPQASVR